MEKNTYKIILAGEGGQGVQSIALAFTRAAYHAGLNVAYMPNYGVEQRGGVSLGFLQLGSGIIGFPKFKKADILIVMCERAVERTRMYVGKETLYLFDSDLISSKKLADIHSQKLPIPATSIATQKLEPKVFNMILAGALFSEIKIVDKKFLDLGLEDIFQDKYKKKAQLRNLNKRAIELGARLAEEVYAG
jgi:2-oxoglutarate ferredoxin oxidoreductase subunit gamma